MNSIFCIRSIESEGFQVTSVFLTFEYVSFLNICLFFFFFILKLEVLFEGGLGDAAVSAHMTLLL